MRAIVVHKARCTEIRSAAIIIMAAIVEWTEFVAYN